VVREGPYPHYDVEGLWGFMLDGLARLHCAHGIEALTVTTHGAAAALLDVGGGLAAPVLDYEHDGPDALAAAYDAVRPDFAETGSPRLPMGLNLGAQIFWQLETQPGLRGRLGHVLTWPQYWVWRLAGVMGNEMTSLGCHTDLWEPAARRFSSLVERLGIGGAMAPVGRAADRVGRVLPEVAARTGLDRATPVFRGIHDSNASLYPHLVGRRAPFAVVSTGTWVIAMAIGGREVRLDPARDTLVNVDAFGDPVPSGRFMGGREFEMAGGGRLAGASEAEVAAVLDRGLMLLPSVEPSSGPFQGRRATWVGDAAGDGERFAALSFYLAMMSATCLGMIGAEGPVVTEGPFARNRLYLAMLAAALGRPVTGGGESATGTSVGAAMLTRTEAPAGPEAAEVAPDPRLAGYAEAWRVAVGD
jgi:sugar (pentulose or hexulose) kinase